jgi:phage-related protein
MANLADILVSLTLDTRQFNRQLKAVAKNIDSLGSKVGQATTNMQTTVQASTNIMASGLGNVNDSMQRMEDIIANTTTRSSSSFSRMSQSSSAMAKRLGTDMQSQYMILRQAQKEYENFSMVGRRVSQEIKDEFSALPSHLQRYAQSLREAGQSTQGFAILNQQYSQRIIQSLNEQNAVFQQKATQASKLMNSISQNTNLAPLTNGFLELGNRMEQTARQGSVLNLALQRVGEGATLKQLNDEMTLISQGIGRARGAFLTFGIAGGLATLGMIKLASAVDERVAPAFERMKSALVDAMEPFIHSFATAMVAVMNFVTNLANMVNKFSEANPLIFNMIMWIGLLTLAFGTLLAPLAVTGVMAEGVAASFAVLWATISPFVLGFLAVIGVAVALSVAFVALWVSIQQLWANSTAFQQAFIAIWNSIKSAVINNFVTPVTAAWNNLKLAFSNLIATVTGGSGTMSSLWTFLGNAIAVVVTNIAGVVLPLFQQAMTLLGSVVSAVINGIVTAVNFLSQAWNNHKAQIMPVLSAIGSAVMTAFQAIASFISSIMPQIIGVASAGWDLIKAAVDFAMKYIAPVVVQAFTIIWNIIQMVMPLILTIIVGTWNNIKSVITSAIAIITNVIQLFANVLKGNWKGAWDNVKNIVKNALTLIWNLIQLYFMGKLLKPIMSFGKAGLSLVKSSFNGMKAAITGVMNGIKAFLVGVWQAILSSLRGSFTGILNLGRTTFNNLKSAISTAVNAIKPIVTRVFNAVKTAMTKPVQSALKVILGIIKKIVSAFASMKISIPKFKLPSVDVGSKSAFGGKVKVPTFKVNWHAKGGIFNAATLLGNGSHGVGEKGNEAVMPIQHRRYMQPFSKAIAENLSKLKGNDVQAHGGNAYTINFNEPVVIREEADINKIVAEMDKKQRIAKRAKGTFSYAK